MAVELEIPLEEVLVGKTLAQLKRSIEKKLDVVALPTEILGNRDETTQLLMWSDEDELLRRIQICLDAIKSRGFEIKSITHMPVGDPQNPGVPKWRTIALLERPNQLPIWVDAMHNLFPS